MLESVTERDIDLLLVEELRCSESFRRWFLAEAMGRGQWRKPSVLQVRHSVSGDGKHAGETDIEVSLTTNGVKVVLLIEDKIDAPFQRDQAERYRLRAAELVEQGRCAQARTVLVAPARYIGFGPTGFDVDVSYEDVMSYFKRQAQGKSERALRSGHRADVLKQAIEQQRRGTPLKPHAALTMFWSDYYALARTKAPLLKMERPGKKPLNSTWVSFNRSIPRVVGLPLCELWHKWPYGRVDLQFSGLSARSDAVTQIIDPLMGPGMIPRKAGKSLALSIAVPELDGTAEFPPQREAALQGLSAALRLRKWYVEHATDLARALRQSNLDRAFKGEL